MLGAHGWDFRLHDQNAVVLFGGLRFSGLGLRVLGFGGLWSRRYAPSIVPVGVFNGWSCLGDGVQVQASVSE